MDTERIIAIAIATPAACPTSYRHLTNCISYFKCHVAVVFIVFKQLNTATTRHRDTVFCVLGMTNTIRIGPCSRR
jgi:hypothetical protein